MATHVTPQATVVLHAGGLLYSGEAAIVERALDRLPGVVKVEANPVAQTSTVTFPGFVRTDFGAEDQAWFFSVISHAVRPFLKTPAQGAQTSIYLASSPEMDGVTGQFVVNGKPKAGK